MEKIKFKIQLISGIYKNNLSKNWGLIVKLTGDFMDLIKKGLFKTYYDLLLIFHKKNSILKAIFYPGSKETYVISLFQK